MSCTMERVRFAYPGGVKKKLSAHEWKKKIRCVKNIMSTRERLRFPYPDGRLLISERKGVDEKNS
jgi:hypothetical protein